MSKAWASGSNRAWRRVRARVLAENLRTNQGRCTLRLRGCTGMADQVHHVLGRGVTRDDPRYLVAACRACNLKVGEPGTGSPPLKRVSSW